MRDIIRYPNIYLINLNEIQISNIFLFNVTLIDLIFKCIKYNKYIFLF